MKDEFLKMTKNIYLVNKSIENDSNYLLAVLIVAVLTIIIITLLLQNEANVIDKEWGKVSVSSKICIHWWSYTQRKGNRSDDIYCNEYRTLHV